MILDAAGHIPVGRTHFENKWIAANQSGEVIRRMDALRERRALPLDEKISLSLERISEWCEAWNNQVAVSYSGGKDSSVLLWLVRHVLPDCPAVFCNTGLEYPEIIAHVQATDNVRIMRPKKPFHHVIRDHGWPVASKKVARGVNILRNPTENNQNVYRLYDEGVNRFGEPVNGFKVPQRWRFLKDAPFEVSDKCCGIMKKEPMHRYERETGRKQFVGIMASDSKTREKVYLQHGCNAFDTKHPRSTPMGFWTEQDVLEAIDRYKLPVAKVYGELRRTIQGELHFTGARSTGCVFCAFGLHMDDIPTRFQMLYRTHPNLWNFCMNKLGLADVLNYMHKNCPDRKLALNFCPEPVHAPNQQEGVKAMPTASGAGPIATGRKTIPHLAKEPFPEIKKFQADGIQARVPMAVFIGKGAGIPPTHLPEPLPPRDSQANQTSIGPIVTTSHTSANAISDPSGPWQPRVSRMPTLPPSRKS